ncbi:MAG: hypothetical protein SGPRY_010782, partial [Prymnesium sp.]
RYLEQRVERTLLEIGFLQLDNQQLYANMPVILAPSFPSTSSPSSTLLLEIERCPDIAEQLSFEYLGKLHLELAPLSMQLEDVFLSKLLTCIDRFTSEMAEIDERMREMHLRLDGSLPEEKQSEPKPLPHT